MSIHKTEAIVLRGRDLRETSLVLTFYTKDFGKLHGVIKGVRGPRAQHGGGSLEPFAHDEIVFYERKESDLFLISQCDLSEYFPSVRSSLERIAYAMYLVELLDTLTPLGDRNQDIFDLLLQSLRLLSGKASPRRVARIFEIRLLKLLGLAPSVASCANCASGDLEGARFSLRLGGLVCARCAGQDRASSPILRGTIEFMRRVGVSEYDMVSRLKVSEPVGKELETLLRKFLDYHIERRLNSVEFIKAIHS
jgi:DNA repair protein RecO (recombination protein O)